MGTAGAIGSAPRRVLPGRMGIHDPPFFRPRKGKPSDHLQKLLILHQVEGVENVHAQVARQHQAVSHQLRHRYLVDGDEHKEPEVS